MSSLRLLAAVWLGLTSIIGAEELRSLAPGQALQDHRLQPLQDLDGYFPFSPPATAEEWNKRAEALRMQMRVSLGLWPAPTKPSLQAVIDGRLDLGDYTVEKVYFESMPGFFVTGNLYRPKTEGKHPGVLCPYGHWPGGRFLHYSDAEVQKAYASRAEHLESAARSPLQARCVQLARMGCVVFHYDMIGKGDSLQISDEVAHGFKKQRPEMNGWPGWGFYSPQAELLGQSIMGLQTWDSIRALDFLQSLEDVDGARLGVTGASGGASQTLMLCALEDRVTAAFPAVMVSTGMQGGCTCENASGLRVGTGNVEIASLCAPKPMAMTCADDWTREMPTKGFPEMQKLWALLGKPENVSLTVGTQFPHNYNAPSRAALYAWFNRHLGLNLPPERLEERDFRLLTREEMSVWDAAHPAPSGGADFEKKLLREWRDDVLKQMQGWNNTLYSSAGWREIIHRDPEKAGNVTWHRTQKEDRGPYWQMTGLIRNDTYGEEIPALFLHPKDWKGPMVLWLSEQGKQGLLTGADQQPLNEIAKLLAAGVGVIGVDLVRQGEALLPGENGAKAAAVKNPREAAAYTLGYNPSLLAQRVHDLMTVAQLVKSDPHQAGKLGVVALDRTALLAPTAGMEAGAAIAAAVLDPSFKFEDVTDVRDPYLVPSALRCDLRRMPEYANERTRFIDSQKPRPEEIDAALLWLLQKIGAPPGSPGH